MVLTNQSVAQPAEHASPSFPPGTYVRVRNPLVDGLTDVPIGMRPFDVGKVHAVQGDTVTVRWSQSDCGCMDSGRTEDPTDLVPITESEYLMSVAAFNTGYNAGYDAAAE